MRWSILIWISKVAPDVLFLAAGLIVLAALASVQEYKNRELLFRASLARDRTQLLELTRAY